MRLRRKQMLFSAEDATLPSLSTPPKNSFYESFYGRLEWLSQLNKRNRHLAGPSGRGWEKRRCGNEDANRQRDKDNECRTNLNEPITELLIKSCPWHTKRILREAVRSWEDEARRQARKFVGFLVGRSDCRQETGSWGADLSFKEEIFKFEWTREEAQSDVTGTSISVQPPTLYCSAFQKPHIGTWFSLTFHFIPNWILLKSKKFPRKLRSRRGNSIHSASRFRDSRSSNQNHSARLKSSLFSHLITRAQFDECGILLHSSLPHHSCYHVELFKCKNSFEHEMKNNVKCMT